MDAESGGVVVSAWPGSGAKDDIVTLVGSGRGRAKGVEASKGRDG